MLGMGDNDREPLESDGESFTKGVLCVASLVYDENIFRTMSHLRSKLESTIQQVGLRGITPGCDVGCRAIEVSSCKPEHIHVNGECWNLWTAGEETMSN